MPSVREYQAVQFPGWHQGLNRHADSSRLEQSEAPEVLNFRLGPRGEMQLRTGYTRHDSTITDQVFWLYPWRSPAVGGASGTDFLIAVDSQDRIWYDDNIDGNFINSGSLASHNKNLQDFGVGFAGAEDALYVSAKGNDAVRKFDGASWTDIATIPDAKHLVHRHGRLYAINTRDNPSRIWFSGFLTPELFAAEDWIDVDPDDGYEINAATEFGDDLMVFKDREIHKLAGRTPESFALYEVDTHRGCVSPRSLAQIRGRLVFFDRDTGIWAFNGASFELLSEKINDYILAGQDYGLSYRASAYVSGDRLYMTIPWATGSFFRTFVYFADTQGWVEYDTGFEDAAFYLANRYQGHPGALGVYRADPASNEFPPFVVSPSKIQGRFRTPWVRVGQAGIKARIRRLEFTFKGPAPTSGTIRMYRDFNEDTAYQIRTFDGGAVPYVLALDTDEREVALDGWGNRLHAVQFEFESEDTPFQVNELRVFYTGGVDVRGER